MSAAVEASIEGIPAVGFSLLNFAQDADFSGAAKYANIIAQQILTFGLPNATLLNVNIPDLPAAELLGIKFADKRLPNGKKNTMKDLILSVENIIGLQENL